MTSSVVGSPVTFNIGSPTGDPGVPSLNEADFWSMEEAMKDVQGWIEAAAGDVTVIAEIQRMIPIEVFQKLKFPPTRLNELNP